MIMSSYPRSVIIRVENRPPYESLILERISQNNSGAPELASDFSFIASVSPNTSKTASQYTIEHPQVPSLI